MAATQKRPKGADEVFCWSCGEPIKTQALICVHCGVLARSKRLPGTTAAGGKSKTAAVLLAVFLSFWSWLYTVKLDCPKFLVGIILNLVAFPMALAVDALAREVGWRAGPPLPTIVLFGLPLAVWIWAIIDRAVRPPEYYSQYPDYR